MLEPKLGRPRWTIGRLMVAVAGAAVLLGLPATFGHAGVIVFGLIVGAIGAAVIPAILVCKIQSRFPSRRDEVSAQILAGSGLIFVVMDFVIIYWIRDYQGTGDHFLLPIVFVVGYLAFLMAAIGGLIEVPRRGVSWTKILSLVVVLITLPFAIGAGMVIAAAVSPVR